MAGCAMRIGQGYDVHKLVPDRKLILGGVDIPYEKGLLGHSDADVIVHAVMDALLGAAGLWDIGHAFPDDDPETDGISSLVLLKRVKQMLDEQGFAVVNIDGTIIAQRPKLSPYIPIMRQNIAEVLGIEEARVNLKATTEEGLGFTGSGEGISALLPGSVIRWGRRSSYAVLSDRLSVAHLCPTNCFCVGSGGNICPYSAFAQSNIRRRMQSLGQVVPAQPERCTGGFK